MDGEHNEIGSDDLQMIGEDSTSSESLMVYSGVVPDLVVGHDHFHIVPAKNAANRRRHPRVPCRNVKACIKADEANIVVDVLDISRSGLRFATFQQFAPGAAVAVAPHYIEGGQNIFQNARIVRVRHKPSGMLPPEYAVEFSAHWRK